MPTVKRRYPKEEFSRMGEAIFEKDVQPHLKGENKNHYLAIDIETGAYEVDADELAACDRLRDRLPEAQIWLRRVGSKYLHSFGGHGLRGKR